MEQRRNVMRVTDRTLTTVTQLCNDAPVGVGPCLPYTSKSPTRAVRSPSYRCSIQLNGIHVPRSKAGFHVECVNNQTEWFSRISAI